MFDLQATPVANPALRRALAAAAVALAVLGAAVGWVAAGGAPAALAQPSRDAACGGVVSATLTASTVSICDDVGVTLRVEPECPACPDGVQIVFVHIDAPQSAWQYRESRKALEEAERLAPPGATISGAVVHYNNQGATTIQRMTDDIGRVKSKLNAAGTGYNPRGQAIEAAQKAVTELNRERGQGDNPCRFIVMFAYAKAHDQVQARELQDASKIILREGVTFMVGCPINPGAWYCRGPEPEMPLSPRWFTEYDEAKLQGMVRDEMRDYDKGSKVREMAVTQLLPAGMDLIQGSASLTPTMSTVSDGGTMLKWAWTGLQASRAQSVTYRLDPSALGAQKITGEMTVTDSSYRKQVAPVPELALDVVDLCPTETPTVVPSATPLDTPIPTPTSTATPTRTPTATATSTPIPTATFSPTPSVFRIYLPMLFWQKEICIPESVYADAVLVLDMSTSMYRETRGGRTKLDAAIDAARLFIDQFSLAADERGQRDQVAIVGFNGTAWTAVGLTSDRAAIDAALAGLPARVQQGTRLDLAFSQGQAALDQGPRMAGNRPVVVVLTDGLPNQVPFAPGGRQEDTVLAAAQAVKQTGTRAFTIGLGEEGDVLRDLLTSAASTPSDYYFAPDGEDLAGIYRQIAGRITECPR